jgi:hypothetical protein
MPKLMPTKIPPLHLLLILDIGWFSVRAGAAYYDATSDAFRPAFVDFMLWRKWRVTFEAGRLERPGSPRMRA